MLHLSPSKLLILCRIEKIIDFRLYTIQPSRRVCIAAFTRAMGDRTWAIGQALSEHNLYPNFTSGFLSWLTICRTTFRVPHIVRQIASLGRLGPVQVIFWIATCLDEFLFCMLHPAWSDVFVQPPGHDVVEDPPRQDIVSHCCLIIKNIGCVQNP